MRLRFLLAFLVVAAAAAAALALDPELAKKAASGDQGDRWAACEPLAKDGSPEALRLLLGILRTDEDHENRDHAAWACGSVPHDDAIAALVAAANGANAPTKARIVWGLGRTRRPAALEALVKIAKSEGSVAVRCDAVEAMARFPESPAALECVKLAARSVDPTLRAAAVESAGALAKGAGREVVLAAWADSDAGLRCAALAAMNADDMVANLPAAAAAEDWRLRAQVVDTALRWRRAECMEPLIGLVADECPRVASAARRAMRFFSGGKDIAPDPELWRGWWAANKAAWKSPGGRPNDAPEAPLDPKATRAKFQGVEIESDRFAFVIDHSGSMDKEMKKGGMMRIDAVREEMAKTLAALPDGLRANLVTFGVSVQSAFGKARNLTDRTRQEILDFSRKTRLEPETNLAGGLLEALEDETIDTIYLLTDGAPSIGDFVSFNRVRIGVERANRRRKVAIHAIGFGVTHQPTRDFLADLANDNGGRCVFR